MTVEAITEHRLRVWLTDDEMHQWGLTQETPAMGRVRRLVRQIATAAGWTERRRVTAELIPVEGGGLLLVSGEVYASPQPLLYHLRDGDDLLDMMRRWKYISARPPLCTVYAYGRGYAVAVHPDEPLSLGQQSVLEEYGIPAGSGEGAVARLSEYGRLLGSFTGCAPTPPEPEDPLH